MLMYIFEIQGKLTEDETSKEWIKANSENSAVVKFKEDLHPSATITDIIKESTVPESEEVITSEYQL